MGKGTYPACGEQSENLLPFKRQQNPQPLAERGGMCCLCSSGSPGAAGARVTGAPAGGQGVLSAGGDPPELLLVVPSLPSPAAEFQSTAKEGKKKKKGHPPPLKSLSL